MTLCDACPPKLYRSQTRQNCQSLPTKSGDRHPCLVSPVLSFKVALCVLMGVSAQTGFVARNVKKDPPRYQWSSV